MRYLLDTNIISNVTKPLPSHPLLEWMAEQIDDDLFISSLSLAEIRRGILEKPAEGGVSFPYDALHVDFLLKAA